MQPIAIRTLLRKSCRLVLTLTLYLFVPLAWSADLYCDDYEREDKVKAAKMKEDIKARARSEGVPERLLHLYDELPDCEMCLEDVSPVPFITIHFQPDGHPKKPAPLQGENVEFMVWDADMEYEARYGLRAGYIQAFYIYIAASKCVCCTARNKEEYDAWRPYPDEVAPSPGWVEELDIDTSLSDAYTDPDGLGDYPPDLTEIDENEQFPDIIEPPPLILPAPIRPITTLCTQCRPQVDAYNDAVKRIRAKQIAIAELKQSRGITYKAIHYRLRAINAHARKAQVGDWQDVLDSMNNHLYDLKATARRETAKIEAETKALSQLIEGLAALRDAVRQCEETCRLNDSQSPPTLTPEPIPYADDAPLPPFVRIASQTCSACTGALETRNEIARQMNAEVTAMTLSGYTEERLARWNSLLKELDNANKALSDCISKCNEPEPDKPAPEAELPSPPPAPPTPPATPADPENDPEDGAAAPDTRTDEEIEEDWRAEFNRCEPCSEYWHEYRAVLEQIKPLAEEYRDRWNDAYGARQNVRAHSEDVKRLEAAAQLDLSNKEKADVLWDLRLARGRLRRATERLTAAENAMRRAKKALREVEARAVLVRARWRHCVATRCRMKNVLPRELYPDQLGYPERFERDDLTMMMFVTTRCEPCEGEARVINDWLLEQYESWLAEYLANYRGRPSNFLPYEGNPQGEQWPNFAQEFALRRLALSECEKQCAPPESLEDALSDSTSDAYQSPSIGSGSCTGSIRQGQQSPGCEDEPVEDWDPGDCDAGACDQGASAGDADGGACDAGTSSSGCESSAGSDWKSWGCSGAMPPPPSCQDDPVMDWYESDCSSGGCDQGAVESDSSGTSCEEDAGIRDGQWWTPQGCTGAVRTSQGWSLALPNDPFLNSSGSIREGLADSWGLQRVGLYSKTGDTPAGEVDPVIVAVIDSGIDHQHPDLQGMLWENAGEVAGNGIDNDGNGFVDDIRGWNFVADNADTRDFSGHGTLVAGIIGAASDNGVGIAGVNPWARIMPLKVTNYLGIGRSTQVAAAVVYAVNNGARIINISLGGRQHSPAEQTAFAYAASKGVLVVVAAGNLSIDTSGFFPAGLDDAFTVAALDSKGQRAAYSNWGAAVDIAAPGTDILSLRARYTDPAFFVDPKYTRESSIVGKDRLLYAASGTSFAAPFVSGAASLLRALRPQLDAAQLKNLLQQNADDVEKPGLDISTGYGLLNVGAAMDASPDFFITAHIAGVSVVKSDGATYLQINGSANAEAFSGATVSLASSDEPDKWQKVATLAQPVNAGELARVPATTFSGAPRWQIRLQTHHENGRKRVGIFDLALR